jgi:hypothetical protein
MNSQFKRLMVATFVAILLEEHIAHINGGSMSQNELGRPSRAYLSKVKI